MGWLEKFRKGLEKYCTRSVTANVMAGVPNSSTKVSPKQMTDWVLAAIDRLDTLVPDSETRRSIMLCCSDLFPEERIEKVRAEYERTGSMEEVLKWMRQDTSWKGLAYYEYPKREENTIYVTKVPYNPKGFEEATDPVRKRVSYCHCPLIRPAVLSGTRVSPTFCLCATGWYKSLWEGVFGKPVRVEILEAVSQGADKCTFAIHLPPGTNP